jgi:hypothetical protein
MKKSARRSRKKAPAKKRASKKKVAPKKKTASKKRAAPRKKPAPKKEASTPMPELRVFAERPTKQQAIEEVKRFFDLLKKGDHHAAGAVVAHKFNDWWPHQVKSLWQDLVVPWLEEQGEEPDLDDEKSWQNVSWTGKIGVNLSTDWDGHDDSFYVNVLYDGADTDVSADFSIHRDNAGWVIRRDIIHIA